MDRGITSLEPPKLRLNSIKNLNPTEPPTTKNLEPNTQTQIDTTQ